jgi:hypothetical protein
MRCSLWCLLAFWLARSWIWSSSTSAAPLEWQSGPGYRFARIVPPADGKAGFELLSPSATGIAFTNLVADERSALNRNLINGAGVAAGDIDEDGWVDVYFCGVDSGNKLFRNLGNWRFEDITEQAGVACRGQDSTGAVFADVDGDGHLDLLVTALGGGLRIFHNDGQGKFTEVTAEAGVASRTGGMSMALGDIDGDGDLDLYVANYHATTMRDRPSTRFGVATVGGRRIITSVDGRPATEPDLTNRFALDPSGEVVEYSEPSDLFLNDGHGHFTRASFTDGRLLDEDGRPLRQTPRDWSLSVRFYDLNGDGAPDLYVCNDLFSPDRIWLNDGKGHFRAMPRLAVRHTSTFSMGMDFADLDRDGNVDFLVVDMVSRDLRNRKVQIAGMSPVFNPIGFFDFRPQYSQNTLQWNRGDGTFAEIAYYSGLEATEWCWQPVFLDVDLDGYEDVLVPTGMLRDFQNVDMDRQIESAVKSRKLSAAELVRLFRQFPGLHLAKLAFHNRGDLTFEEVGASWGFNTTGIAQGMALADLDNDGALDVLVNNLNSPAQVYRNTSPAPRIGVRLKGLPPNTRGIGAKIRVLGGPVPQSQEMVAGGRYLSSDDPMRTFAAGNVTNRLTIEVTWRSGRSSVVSNALPNCIYEIEEPRTDLAFSVTNSASSGPPKAAAQPYFADVSQLLNHTHHEEPFDDFSLEPLLPRMLSQLGPGVSWIDLDNDGWDDLVVGTGKGGRLAAFHNDGHGGFSPIIDPPFGTVLTRDTTTILGLVSTNEAWLLAGSANYEDGLEQGAMARTFDLKRRVVEDRLPGQRSSTGPMALADVDGDGQLDLFIGGRVVAGHYPEAASSFLFLNRGGKFTLDPQNVDVFANIGLVTGCVFSDLDGDGYPELIVACEWGPVRIFHNNQGKFSEVTEKLGLAAYTGWWNGVTTADLDGDGKLDIIAGNWGLNTRYRATPSHPVRLYYGDYFGTGRDVPIESCFDPALGKYVPERSLPILAFGLPFVAERYSSNEQYANASIDDVLGDKLSATHQVEAAALASMVFFNRGDHFEAVPLPREAQFTPAFAVCAGDFDGDGNLDVLLSQNFFDSDPMTRRDDAGRGLWLRGDGRGGLKPVPGQESGIQVYGEQRGAALCDFDQDGRVDLVVTQNGAQTKLYHNVMAKPGLRVRLRGAIGNPHGVGATVRVKFGERFGPAQEIHAGSGYWSQDSPVLVFGTPSLATAVWTRWPGGRTTITPVPSQAREVVVPSPQ